MVEFAVVCLVFLTIVAGIIDLGLAFYTKQVITNASREGARYGVVYVTDASGSRVAPASFSSSNVPPRPYSVANYATNYLGPLPTGITPTVSVSGDTSVTMGNPLTVTVTGTYNWIVLGRLVPGLGTSITLTGKTIMQLE